MSSLNITTKMKATSLHGVAVERSQALVLGCPIVKKKIIVEVTSIGIERERTGS